MATQSLQPARTDQPGLEITPSVQVAYDSNIFRTDSRLTPSVDDTLLTGRLEAQLRHAFGEQDVRLHGDVAYQQYLRNSSRSRPRLAFDGDARVRIAGACQIVPSGKFLYELADYGDINRAVDNYQTFGTIAASASCPRAAGFFPLASVARDTTRNSPAFRYANQNAFGWSAGVGYARPSLGTVSAYYAHLSSDRYTLGLVNDVERAGVTFRRAVVSAFMIDGDVHYLAVTSRGANVPRYRGIGWDGGLTFRPLSGLSLEGRFARRVVNDSLVPAGYAIQTDYTGTARWRLSERTSITARAQYGERGFRRDPALIASPVNSDRFSNYALSVARDIGARLRLAADVKWIGRRTDSSTNNFDATIAALTASARF